MTDLERVKKTVNWLIFQNFAENEKGIADIMGYTKSSFSQIINGKVPLSDKFVDKLASIDKNINKVWILTGSGEMLKKSATNQSNTYEIPDKTNLVAENNVTYSQQKEYLKEGYVQISEKLFNTMLEREDQHIQEVKQFHEIIKILTDQIDELKKKYKSSESDKSKTA